MTRPWLDGNANRYPICKLAHVGRLKARIGWQNLRSDEFVDDGPHCVTGTDFRNGSVNWDSSYRVSPERYAVDSNIQLSNDDLLITKDGTIGKVAIVRNMPGPATLNSGVFLLRAQGKGFYSPYMKWVVQSKVFDDFIVYNSAGATINHLYQNVFEQFRFPYPARETQKNIADFLDHETAHIDQLIEKKQRLIALLSEKEAATVDALLTGRNIGEPQQHVESCRFLSEIPSSWQMRRLKSICSHLGNGLVGPTRDILIEGAEENAVPYIQSTHIKNRRIDFNRRPYFVDQAWLAGKPKVQIRRNDLLIVQTGVGRGATSIVNEEFDGAGCHALIVTRPIEREIEPRLLLHLLSSSYGQSKLESIQTGALHPHLEVGFVKDISLPIPPRDGQALLVDMIDVIIPHSERCSDKAILSINRLREFRSALITAAVTGQIDIAEWDKRNTNDRRLDDIQAEMVAAAPPERVKAPA